MYCTERFSRFEHKHVKIIPVAIFSVCIVANNSYSVRMCMVNSQLAFLKLCDQAFNPPFLPLGGKIIELAKFCFMNKRFETNLSFFSKPVIVSDCV